MKKNSLLYIICTLAVGMCSLNACYKPTTNYDFHDINEIRVDSFGSYLEVVQFDTLTVTPHITASMDPSVLDDTTRYTYEWLAGKPGVTYTAHQLGNKRNLKVRLNIPVGSYRLYFTMKDKLTGQIANMRSVRLDVTSKTFEGWLILSDVQGNAALDFVNWNSNGTKTIVRNLLDNSPDLPKPLKGPRNVAYVYCPNPNIVPTPTHNASAGTLDREWIYVTTDQGAWKFRNDYLTTQWRWNSFRECLFPVDSSSFKPAFFGTNSGGYATNGNLLMTMPNGDIYERTWTAWYVIKSNQVQGEANSFRAAPFIGKYYTSSGNTVLFDMDKKRFVRTSPGSFFCTTIPNPATDPKFDFSNVGMDMLYMRTSPYGLTFAVMKDAAGDIWLLTFDARSTVVQDKKVKLTGTDIKLAEAFTVDKNYGTLFYKVGNKLYATHKDLPDVSYEILNTGSRQISFVDQHIFTINRGQGANGGYINGGAATPGNPQDYVANYLAIGTYDPADPKTTGKLELYYPTDFMNGHAALTKKDEYGGFGKIVSVSFRERPTN